MDWLIVGSVAAGGALGAGVTILAGRLVRRRSAAPARAERGPAQPTDRGQAGIADPRGGLARKSLDSLRVGVVVLDSGDQPVLVNASARAMGLLRAARTPGTHSAHPVVRTLAAQVRRSGVRREVELDLPRLGDRAADPLGVRLRAMALGSGYVAVEAADATESHRVARVRRDFVANVGHELKTPIGALQLLSEALLDATGQPAGAPARPAAAPGADDPTDDAAAVRRFAERIHHESTRLARLVTELLELSRVQGAEPLPEQDPVQVDWLVSEALDRAGTGAAAKQIEITVTGEAGLVVYGNRNQLATALANLVENGVAYSQPGGRVEIRCRGGDQSVEIAVVDYGIGIAAAEQDRVFERFYRSDQARSRATGGTGLGLAIVKHIATNHGGRVEVNSTPGRGSTFTLRLPASPDQVARVSPGAGEIGAGQAAQVSG